MYIAAYRREKRRASGGRGQRLMVERGPGVVFRRRNRLSHAVNRLGSQFSRKGPQSERGVTCVIEAEVGMVKSFIKLNLKIFSPFPFAPDKGHRHPLQIHHAKDRLPGP